MSVQLHYFIVLTTHQPQQPVLSHRRARATMPSVSILGIMVSRSSRWIIRSWLRRHAAMFERLAVLDGSPAGSIDAVWMLEQCSLYANVVCQLESQASIGAPATDQTARRAAMKLLARPGDTRSLDAQLEGRWILNAHPDEFFLQDIRQLAAQVSMRDPRATCVLFGAAYVLPTRDEFESIAKRFSNRVDGHKDFSPMEHLLHADAEYPFKEPRLWKFVPGTRWGTRHGLTTPEIHPDHRVWPTVREVKLGASPFFVHFKVHDFGPDAFTLTEGCGRGVLCSSSSRSVSNAKGRTGRDPRQSQSPQWWIAFNRSGFSTGLAPHRTHGRLHVERNRSARETVLSYYESAGRSPASLEEQIRRRCSRGVVPRCTVGWSPVARFKAV